MSKGKQTKSYVITETSGCTAYGISVNGRPLERMTSEEQREVESVVLAAVARALAAGQTNLSAVLGCIQYDDCQWNEHSCDQCGDTVSWTTWKIEA